MLCVCVCVCVCALLDYICGSPSNWSKLFTMRTFGDVTSSPTLAVYGDLGYKNGQSIPWLKSEAINGTIDGVLHCGDIAYNLFNVSAFGGRGGCLQDLPSPPFPSPPFPPPPLSSSPPSSSHSHRMGVGMAMTSSMP